MEPADASPAILGEEIPQTKAWRDGSVPGGWEAVYRAHAGRIGRWVVRLAGPGADVEDLVHDVFVRVRERGSSFRGDSALTTWLYGITVNVVRAHRRRQRFRRWIAIAPEVEPLDPGAGPERQVDSQRALERAYAALDGLSERDRRLLILHRLEGIPASEIAELEGMTDNAVFVALHRATKRFAARVEKLEGGG